MGATPEFLQPKVKPTYVDQRVSPETALGKQSIQRRATGGPCPASFAQESLWFLQQLEPGNPFYNIQTGLRMHGELNERALRRALNAILARHESLRTTFIFANGVPMQVVSEAGDLDISLTDITGFSEIEREAELQRIAAADLNLPFNLASDVMIRARLVRLRADEHVLLLCIHHIVSDGWSWGLLWQELGESYTALLAGREPSLPKLSIQYADFAAWQRERFERGEFEDHLTYWRQQLRGIPELHPIATDKPRPQRQSYRGKSERSVLPAALVNGLKQISWREGVTLYMSFLAALEVLLHCYTGSDDIVIGSPIANRTDTELEPLIGFFANVLVLRGDLSGNPSFRELLHRVRDVALAAYEHQELPFDKLVQDIHPYRSLAYNPLVQVMLAFQNLQPCLPEMPGLTVKPYRVNTDIEKFDLSVFVEGDAELEISLSYNPDLFETATIRRMLAHYRNLLQAVVAEPEHNIGDLPLLSEAEKGQILCDWNDTRQEYPQFPIHELFARQAEKTPDAIAACCGSAQITYGELHRVSNQLAHALTARGVKPDTLVGICMHRSIDMIVGLLGILKAGGAYVPLDPTFPPDRLAWMVKDSQLHIVVLQPELAGCLPVEIETVAVNSKLDEQRADIVVSSAGLQNLAYVLYTSGSTGQPKGVAIEHASLANYLSWFNQVALESGIGLLPAVTSLAFDASLKQLFAPLLRGAAVWIVRDDVIAQPAVFWRELSQRQDVALNCAPTIWRSLLDSLDANPGLASPTLKFLLLGGESLDSELIERSWKRFPRLKIWNLYGPSEATANATCAQILSSTSVSIGRPIANTQIYIMDRNLHPVPVGVPGEIYVGGIGVGRGYLQRPELTAHSFVPNPFVKQPGERLYRTGDRGRFQPDGRIEFLGRLDDQVKIRGVRIELGEIECTLARHPALQAAVVAVQVDPRGEKRLIAYVVLHREQEASRDSLRNFLKTTLPDYMLPSQFVFLDSFPMLPTGKVDRRALPAPPPGHAEETYVAPRSELERHIVEIWEKVLGVSPIGIRDDFFDLGGHSLLAMQVMNRVGEILNVRPPVRVLFEQPTVAHLAEAITRCLRTNSR